MTDQPQPTAPTKPASFLGALAWAMYDWANSAYAAVISTFVFSAYFTKAVAADPIAGTEMWGYAISASSFCVAISAPVLGAIADRGGRRKPWIFVFTLGLVIATALMWYVEPSPSSVVLALVLAAAANFTFETATVFYNAMLPDVAGRDRIGRLSGWAWGFGYAGGIVCLVVLLVGFVQPEVPWLGLDKETAEHVRISGPFVAIWLALFSLPLFLFTPDTPSRGLPALTAVRDGIATLRGTLKRARDYDGIIVFLIGYMIYMDGLGTMFTFGGIYAAGTFGMEQAEVIQLGIGMSVTAGIGAFAMAWVDDWMGPKRTILISLLGLIVFGLGLRAWDRPVRGPGPGGGSVPDGASRPRPPAHGNVRLHGACRQGHGLRRPRRRRLGHQHGRKPASRHGDGDRLLCRRVHPDPAGAGRAALISGASAPFQCWTKVI